MYMASTPAIQRIAGIPSGLASNILTPGCSDGRPRGAGVEARRAAYNIGSNAPPRRYTPRVTRRRIHTDDAPNAIGSYSQAIRVDETVYLSGQIPLDPGTMQVVEGPIERQIERVFENLRAVAEAAGGSLANIAKLTVYLTDLGHFKCVNEVMARYFEEPFPARAALGVAALPLGVPVEIDAILVLDSQRAACE